MSNIKPSDKELAQDEREAQQQGKSKILTNFNEDLATILDLNKNEKRVLTNKTIEGIVEYMKSEKCKKIITMVGAGISTSAGIPDFRSPNSGLYANLQKYNLPDPQAVFQLDYFKQNPKPFYSLAKELYPGNFKPTICHSFIKLLDLKGLLFRHYTQNIDSLERIAGLNADKLVEAHGTFYTSHCLTCRKEYPMSWMKEKIFGDEIPKCSCGAFVKPDITFFGEKLPERFYTLSYEDFSECDLLIIMGSSLVVKPFSTLINRVPSTCPRLLINLTKSGHTDRLSRLLGRRGMDFDAEGETARDVFWQGTCDAGSELLASKLGWEEELKALVKNQKNDIIPEEKEDTDCTRVV